MTYDFKLSCTLPASPEAVYDAWLDSAVPQRNDRRPGQDRQARRRTPMPPGTATSPAKRWSWSPAGASCSRGAPANSPIATPNSTITVELEPTKTGTRLTLTHSGVPDDQTDYENGGWRDFYFSPMKAYFARENLRATHPKKGPRTRRRNRLRPRGRLAPLARHDGLFQLAAGGRGSAG